MYTSRAVENDAPDGIRAILLLQRKGVFVVMDREIRGEIQGASIVALGDFNPAIFQPLWLSANNLIREEEAKEAKLRIIRNDIAVFSTEWFSLQVIDQRYTVETEDPTKFFPLRDLAYGTFNILEHTPIRAFGFNRYQHFEMASEEEWHLFGHYYVPKEPWQPVLEEPGTQTLAVRGKRKDSSASYMEFKMEPSDRVPCGVCLRLNEHHGLPDASNPKEGLLLLLEKLESAWDGFLDYWQMSSKHLLHQHKKGDG